MTTSLQTPYGIIEGFQIEGICCFLGIPYAMPPLGELRFRQPQPIKPWTDVFQAKGFAKDPIQSNLVWGPDSYSEDCLYLNIWVPENAYEKMPVMVWIPGGAFANGGSGAINPKGPALYDGRTISRETGCIVVSITYRLNVFGFLNLASYSDRFENHLGIYDIICALKWIHEAIESFGGDRNNITLFGESAGATAITVLMMIDEALPLFQKAIIQSNCFGSLYTQEESKEICDLFLKYLEIAPDNVEKLLKCNYQQLLSAAQHLNTYVLDYYTGRCTFCPVVDGTFIKDFPTLADLSNNDKPVLIGSNKNEGNFQVLYVWDDPERYAPKLLRRLHPNQQNELLATYCDFPSKKAFGELLTDTMYAFSKIRFAEHLSRGKAKVFMYRYDYVTSAMQKLGLDASHVAELLPLFELTVGYFREFYLGSEDEVHIIGKRMRAYWGSFARNGTPDVPELEPWLPYSESERNTLLINLHDECTIDPEVQIRDKYKEYDRILI